MIGRFGRDGERERERFLINSMEEICFQMKNLAISRLGTRTNSNTNAPSSSRFLIYKLNPTLRIWQFDDCLEYKPIHMQWVSLSWKRIYPPTCLFLYSSQVGQWPVNQRNNSHLLGFDEEKRLQIWFPFYKITM